MPFVVWCSCVGIVDGEGYEVGVGVGVGDLGGI